MHMGLQVWAIELRAVDCVEFVGWISIASIFLKTPKANDNTGSNVDIKLVVGFLIGMLAWWMEC